MRFKRGRRRRGFKRGRRRGRSFKRRGSRRYMVVGDRM